MVVAAAAVEVSEVDEDRGRLAGVGEGKDGGTTISNLE